LVKVETHSTAQPRNEAIKPKRFSGQNVISKRDIISNETQESEPTSSYALIYVVCVK